MPPKSTTVGKLRSMPYARPGELKLSRHLRPATSTIATRFMPCCAFPGFTPDRLRLSNSRS